MNGLEAIPHLSMIGPQNLGVYSCSPQRTIATKIQQLAVQQKSSLKLATQLMKAKLTVKTSNCIRLSNRQSLITSINPEHSQLAVQEKSSLNNKLATQLMKAKLIVKTSNSIRLSNRQSSITSINPEHSCIKSEWKQLKRQV